MVIVYADGISGWVNPPPHERTLKVLLSPNFQPITQGLGMGMVILPAGRSSSAHTHETEQEVWYVVSGWGRVRIGDEEAEIRPDTVVVAPPGLAHQLINDGEDDLKAIWLFTPAGPEVNYLPPQEGEEKAV
jgi:mannose-6-phosphate isomerase-like protein (cupin superfamily)